MNPMKYPLNPIKYPSNPMKYLSNPFKSYEMSTKIPRLQDFPNRPWPQDTADVDDALGVLGMKGLQESGRNRPVGVGGDGRNTIISGDFIVIFPLMVV